MTNPRILNSIVEAIGHTPLLALDRLTREGEGRILAKLEYFSPGHSKKDRIALAIIKRAQKDGSLQAGQAVVELTSGNTGTGLAIVCRALGHPFVAVMSAGNSRERASMMQALGAEIVMVEQALGAKAGEVSGEDLRLVQEAAEREAKMRGGFLVNQFANPANAAAHEWGTGPEIIEQSGGQIDAFCDFVGTGGTFQGCAHALKRHRADIRCYVVEPKGCPALAGGEVSAPSHPIQGGGYSRRDLLIDRKLIDGFVAVPSEDALNVMRRLAQEEGVFGGISGGANVAAALALLQDELRGATIATLIPDSGMKYFSTGVWER